MRAPSRKSLNVSERLRSLRSEALRSGKRVFQLVELGGVPVRSFVVRGEFHDVASALASARQWGVSSCIVREWACLPRGFRVHVNSVEWLLEWVRISAIRPEATEGGSTFDGPDEVRARRGLAERPPVVTSKYQGFSNGIR